MSTERSACRSLLARATFGIAFLFAAAGFQDASAASCDPHRGFNDAIKTERYDALQKHRPLDGLLARVNDFLSNTDGSDFRASYLKGLLLLDIAEQKNQAHSPGIQQLVNTSNLLAKQDPTCAKEGNFYSIYNTIGFEYYTINDYGAALNYYTLADANRSLLTTETQAKVADNLGVMQLIYANNAGCAAVYFRRAQTEGSETAKAHLSFALKAMAAAGQRENCVLAVYIQYANDNAGSALGQLEAVLVQQGYPAAGIQRISGQNFEAGSPNEVKYFHDSDLREAQRLADTSNALLAKACRNKPPELVVAPKPAFSKNPTATHQLEIWYAGDCTQ